MADDDYWNTSGQVGFDFGDTDELAFGSTGGTRLSAAIRKTAGFDDAESLHFGGFNEFAEKKTLSPDSGTGPLAFYVSKPQSSNLLLKPKTALLLKLEPKIRGDQTESPTPQKTIIDMILGLPYCLEQYKGKDEKLTLLKTAIKYHDGNAIIAIVLFLRNTLKKSVFHRELLERSEAINHYLYYLQANHEHDELANMFLMLGKAEDAAMLRYKSAIAGQHPETKIKKLQNCLSTHFQSDSVSPFLSSLVQEHIFLLQRQLPIEDDDARQEREGLSEVFKILPRNAVLIDTPVISTLYYCCLYHYSLPENHLASPLAIKKQHQLTDKQFVWTALVALSRCHRWSEIDSLFQSKTWLRGTKMKCCIGFHKAAEVLHKASAPLEVVSKYVKMIENSEERLNMAKKCECHQLVIETLTSMRDRQGLVAYKSKLLPHTTEFLSLQEVLRTATVKWKN